MHSRTPRELRCSSSRRLFRFSFSFPSSFSFSFFLSLSLSFFLSLSLSLSVFFSLSLSHCRFTIVSKINVVTGRDEVLLAPRAHANIVGGDSTRSRGAHPGSAARGRCYALKRRTGATPTSTAGNGGTEMRTYV